MELEARGDRLTLLPEAGGAIAGWRVEGQPMLREASAHIGPGWNPFELAGFPLVPYSNRIAAGRFEWNGASHNVPPDVAGLRHPLHGVGWRTAWEVVERRADRALLMHHHPGGGEWPWAYTAEQLFLLSGRRLTVELAVTNRSDAAAPLGIGLHPYFEAAGAQLTFTARRIWRTDSEALFVALEDVEGASDFSTGRSVEGAVLDNCFDGWDGSATIRWAGRPLGLRILSDLPCAVVYTPADLDFFCFEPVPHSNDAFNLLGAGQPMPVVPAGERMTARVEFVAEELE